MSKIALSKSARSLCWECKFWIWAISMSDRSPWKYEWEDACKIRLVAANDKIACVGFENAKNKG